MTSDPRVDEYIARAAPFARPILDHLRALVHEAAPGVTEAIKWGMPHFVWRGKNLAGMAAFKAHAAFILHGEGREDAGMGSYGKLTAIDELLDRAVLIDRLRAACAVIEAGKPARTARAKRSDPAGIAAPDDLLAALNAQARAFFDSLSPSQRREYVDWIIGAKRAETRAGRIAQAAQWLDEGKRRNWKYE